MTKVIKLADLEAITPESRTWAAAALDLPTRVEWMKSEVHDYEADGGNRFREAGYVVADLDAGAFIVKLRRGAREDDLGWLLQQVEAAKGGQLALWSSCRSGYGMEWDRQVASAEGETVRRSYLLVQCDEPGCINFGSSEPYHSTGAYELDEDAWWSHTAEFEACRDGYAIEVWRAHNEAWQVRVTASDCGLTAGQAAGFASDLRYAAREAERMNTPKLVEVA